MMRAHKTFCAVASLCALAGAVRAAPETVLKMATIAPDGTSWAREIRAFQRELESLTNGTVTLHIYFGGIAGDELQMADRVERGQLDVVASSGMLCERVAPAQRALRLVGIYQSAGESSFVANQLRPMFEEQARTHGFTYVADYNIGVSDIFTRAPVKTLEELQRVKLWLWDLDEVQKMMLEAMGFNLYLAPLADAGHAFAEHKHEGFISVPGAMLAFQWSAQAKYVVPVELNYLIGCVLVSNRAFDRLAVDQQKAIRLAAAKLHAHVEDQLRQQDEKLLGGLFQHQGLSKVAVDDKLKLELRQAAERARGRLGERLIPADLQRRVLELVERYRARASAKPTP
jgi:TRAP-type C4-dicarboxylate transport system substrate-binding protein